MTLKVPVELAAKLKQVSTARRVSKSRIVREALEKALSRVESLSAVSAYAAMKPGLGIVKDAPDDLSTNPKHMAGFGK